MKIINKLSGFTISKHFPALLIFTILIFFLSSNTVAWSNILKKLVVVSLTLKIKKTEKLNTLSSARSNTLKFVNPTIITKDTIPANNQDDKVFTIVEQQPEFPGGMKELSNFILRNIRLPQNPKYANAKGTVYTQFIITKQGKIKDIRIVKGINPGADFEAKNLISRMPDWIPGKQNGKPVNVQYTLPLKFQFKTEFPTKNKPG
ncbi:energy transducer TonB [Adhaeribacter radiodurans]|uniref:Energy transducer TonB n=1 Tax=Adhaeribacter radiodurans TaxID=2745197 RepID=A0A7L7LBN3_9BACT|nr:energy transducer TonB [Adhaeribacter radiodurans]QMU29799.1 energy transducer TonB [Adhaeribacter radiodurans]